MRFAVGSDEDGFAPDAVVASLTASGHDVTRCPTRGWADVARDVASRVATGEVDNGVLFCWTGTGVSIAANKVSGVRAALCVDAETARGARLWNDANVLCLSLRLTTEALAMEILAAWMESSPDGTETEQIARVEGR